jgi:hypothetical protein
MNLQFCEAAAYIAGFIDGEGYIGIKWTEKQRMVPRICISNTHEGVLLIIKYILESWEVSSFVCSAVREGNRKLSYSLNINSSCILTVLENILPYLIVKQQQARLILEFCTLRKLEGKFGNNYVDREQVIYEELKVLNKRGL